MNTIDRIIYRCGFMVGVLALAACTGQPTIIRGQVQTPLPVIPTGTGSPTSPAATAIPPYPAVTGQPDQSTPVGGGLVVTLQDDGATISLHAGQRFLLNLGETYNWSPSIADEAIVSRVVGITVIRGAQGVYEAHMAGKTTLSATGDPLCRSQKPACMLPSIIFRVNIVVQ
ncbi:MAG: hypothetical protein PHQ40_10650 [Anaerolineaceae bacterium]|nr:hypothetical protein [Anaerolineaceae bacterium]